MTEEEPTHPLLWIAPEALVLAIEVFKTLEPKYREAYLAMHEDALAKLRKVHEEAGDG